MNNNPTYQQPLCSPCATCDESNTTTTRKQDENETKTTANDAVRCVPQLRFPEFQNEGDWEDIIVEDAIKTITPSKKLQSKEFKTKGKFPIIDQSQVYICGYSDDETAILNKDLQEVIIFGDHTCILKLVDFPFIQGADGIKIFRSKNKKRLDTKFLYYILQHFHIEPIAYKRHFGDLRSKKIYYPNSIIEQQKIAACLQTIDDEIATTTQKLEQLKTHKKALLQKLFPQRGKTTPELRFPEFQNGGKWETRNLGEVTTIVNKRNRSNRSLPIYSISNKDGFLLQTEQFDGLDSVKRGYDISMYKIVGKNTFAYNPARINVGSIGYSNNLKEVLISSLYVCFKTTEEVDDSFLKCYFDTLDFRQSVESNVEGGIRSYLFYENFSRIKIQLPSIQEQKQIASTLMSINALIEIVENKIALLEEHKKGLLQRLFPSLNK